jgi:hypothetical protein
VAIRGNAWAWRTRNGDITEFAAFFAGVIAEATAQCNLGIWPQPVIGLPELAAQTSSQVLELLYGMFAP